MNEATKQRYRLWGGAFAGRVRIAENAERQEESGMKAEFNAQAWYRDYALSVDPQGDTVWTLSPAYLAEMDRTEPNWRTPGTYDRDALRLDPAAPEWVRNWVGPFEVEIPELDD